MSSSVQYTHTCAKHTRFKSVILCKKFVPNPLCYLSADRLIWTLCQVGGFFLSFFSHRFSPEKSHKLRSNGSVAPLSLKSIHCREVSIIYVSHFARWEVQYKLRDCCCWLPVIPKFFVSQRTTLKRNVSQFVLISM